MAISIYDQLIPVLTHMLRSLDAVLAKGETDCTNRKIDPQVFINGRLAPDMLPLKRQVQIATDHAKGAASRLAGVENPRWADDENSLPELRARIGKTIDYLGSFKPEQFEGADTRTVEVKLPSNTLQFTGKDYLLRFAIPNFYFHYTTAYAILRHNGVPIGKRDFLGGA